MSTAINFSLTNNAAVAKTFTLMSASQGFNGPAGLWYLKEGAHSGVFPLIKISSSTGPKEKKSHTTLRFPQSYVDTTTGLTKAGSAVNVELKVTVPDDYPESAKLDPLAFLKAFVASATFADMFKEGSSPT